MKKDDLDAAIIFVARLRLEVKQTEVVCRIGHDEKLRTLSNIEYHARFLQDACEKYCRMIKKDEEES